MGSNQDIVFNGFFEGFGVWQPLAGERGPLETVCHYKVVKVGSIFLPDLVLGINEPFL